MVDSNALDAGFAKLKTAINMDSGLAQAHAWLAEASCQEPRARTRAGFREAGPGGWGLFDSPVPWAPWTTVFFALNWGLGRTHGYRIPSKWIDAEDDTLAVLFSGRGHQGTNYDAFCVQRMRLELATAAASEDP